MILELLEKIVINPVCQDILIISAIVLIVYLFNRSKNSRKQYKCPNCGENIKVEYMKAKYCNICGHELQENLSNTENE